MMWMFSLTVLLAVSGALSSIPNRCPSSTKISPCKCKPNYDGACVIQCQAAKYDDLVKLSKLPNLCEGHVHFILVHSTLPGIPGSLWNVLLSSKTVDVSFKYSNVTNLMPPEEPELRPVSSPGEGALKVTHCGDISGWKWSLLKEYTPGKEFTIVVDDTPFPRFDPEFTLVGAGKVTKVVIDQAQLSFIPQDAFSSFEQLSSLSLQLNDLKEIQRSILPRPASKLQYLHLNGNSFSTLPEDLFFEMPSLLVVYLRENQITTLPENLFSHINSKALHLIDFVENPWVCDCKLMKLMKSTSLNIDMGNCGSPEELAGQPVRQLQDSLRC